MKSPAAYRVSLFRKGPFMSNRSLTRLLAAVLAAIALLAGLASSSVFAQDDEAVLLRAFACPDASPADTSAECEHMIGATFTVEANGVETAESPVTTVADVGIGPGATLTVPAGADLTITLVSGAPDGYVPAPGFDPFSSNVDDLPQVGFGGESTGPGVNFIAVPSDTSGDDGDTDDNGSADDGSTGDDTSGTTTLPETGTGPATLTNPATPIAMLLIAATLFGAGVLTRRFRAV